MEKNAQRNVGNDGNDMTHSNIYFDNAATTKVHPEVIKTITDTMTNIWGNPSSLHYIGQQAKHILDNARKLIAKHINCNPNDIIFTSGACESNSLSICGFLNKHPNSVLITTPIEHKSIQALCENNDYDIKYVKVDNNGRVDSEHLEQLCSETYLHGYSHILVSIQSANSEIGTIQDIKSISSITHKYNGVFHTDATQLFPYQKINVKELGIDMLSMSGQKINAPKGIGFLYVKNGIDLKPLIYGSQMEFRRGGTENIPYIAGLAKAIELLQYENTYVQSMRDYLLNKFEGSGSDYIVNGDLENRLPNNINISFKGIEAESLLLLLDMNGICVSSGSACDSKSIQASSVLKAIGIPDDYIHGTIRITLSNENTFDELNYVFEKILQSVNILRSLNNQ